MIKKGETLREIFLMSYEEADTVLQLGTSVEGRLFTSDIPLMSTAFENMSEKLKDFYCAKDIFILNMHASSSDRFPCKIVFSVEFSMIKDY